MVRIGIVVIGRNEGERLVRCFDSLPSRAEPIVYVDSASTDGSVAQARRRGIDVIELDMSIPFTAARARSAGFERLLDLDAGIEFVQFVDGDCEVQPGWFENAASAITRDDAIAVVSGRLRERFREASVYNRMCDMEWDSPIGEVTACGGNAMMRVAALRAVGGFDGRITAGEEPELCFRLRSRRYRILKVAAEMALHDAAMTRFIQWWRRATRTGQGSAELGAIHRGMLLRQRYSSFFWGLILPVVAFAMAPFTHGLSLAILLGYPALWLRIFQRRQAGGDSYQDAAIYATFCVVGKLPELLGQAKYWFNRCRGRRSTLIEHK